jgi:hypothetical protein
MESRRSGIRTLTGLTVLALAMTSWSARGQQAGVLEPPRAATPVAIAIEQGRITVSIRDAPFGSVLQELAARTGAVFVPAEDIDTGTSRMSAQLSDVPLDEGLRRLLRNYDVFFHYGATDDGPPSLRAVWIYRKGAAANLRPVPPEVWASTRELHANLADPDPLVRARSYEALLSRPGNDSRDLVIQALRGSTEPDDAVRERVLAVAAGTEMRLPPDLLMDLAQSDRSTGVRLSALNALALEPVAKDAASRALSDPDARIRKRAKEILAELQAPEIER